MTRTSEKRTQLQITWAKELVQKPANWASESIPVIANHFCKVSTESSAYMDFLNLVMKPIELMFPTSRIFAQIKEACYFSAMRSGLVHEYNIWSFFPEYASGKRRVFCMIQTHFKKKLSCF